MKNKILAGLAIGVMMSGAAGFAGATTINFDSIDSADNKTSKYTYFDDFQMETFNNTNLAFIKNVTGLDQQSWIWEGKASTVNGSRTGYYAPPVGLTKPDKTNYLSAPNEQLSSGSVTVTLGKEYTYMGLWWSSIDNFNTISFFNGSTLVDSYNGDQIVDPSLRNENGTKLSIYVNFMKLDRFDRFTLASSQNAFEADNIAVGNTPVPEPATMILFGTGLAGLAAIRRKRTKK